MHALGEGDKLIKAAENVLRKFGHFKWCDEIGKVIDVYTTILRIQMTRFL